MAAGYVGGLFGVITQVIKHECHREAVIQDLCGGLRPFGRQLESTLADRKSTIAVIVDDRFVKRPRARFSRERPG